MKFKAEHYCLKNAAIYITEPIRENFELNYQIANEIILKSEQMNKILELITKNKFNKLKNYIKNNLGNNLLNNLSNIFRS